MNIVYVFVINWGMNFGLMEKGNPSMRDVWGQDISPAFGNENITLHELNKIVEGMNCYRNG